MADYPYPIAAFPQQAVNPDLLASQVPEVGISRDLANIDVSDPALVVFTFDTDLSAADKDSLDGLVAFHTDPTTGSAQRQVSAAEDTNATDDWQNKVTLAPGPSPKGRYLVTWYSEMKLDADSNAAGAMGRLKYQGAEQGFGACQKGSYCPFGGSVTIDCAEGDEPVIELAFRRIGAAAAASMRRAQISFAALSVP
jgi:hypothetical protein